MTKAHGTIIYYDSDGGPILRTVTADDVAALEQQLAELRHDLNYYMYGIGQLERLVQIADAIMRAQPVGIPPRLMQAWNGAREKVGH